MFHRYNGDRHEVSGRDSYGNYTVILHDLIDGTYDNIRLTITDISDNESEEKILRGRERFGIDGALLRDENYFIIKVNFIEKILATILAKISNFIPEAGIWMNTQRPEWNDANNALVGNGVSAIKREKLFIDKVLKQTNRMNDIIDDLLKLSRIEFQEEGDSIMLVKTPAISIIDGAIDDVRSFLEKEKKQIEVKCDPKLNIRVDALLIREAINNLLHNAIKYGDQTSNINIFVNVKENIQIVVENRGQIIPKKYRKRIFERFFRVDKSRSRSAGGTGLGLSIVKHILFVHNGSVNYSSLEDDINRFTLKIPF